MTGIARENTVCCSRYILFFLARATIERLLSLGR